MLVGVPPPGTPARVLATAIGLASAARQARSRMQALSPTAFGAPCGMHGYQILQAEIGHRVRAHLRRRARGPSPTPKMWPEPIPISPAGSGSRCPRVPPRVQECEEPRAAVWLHPDRDVPSAAAIPIAAASTRAGVPATTSIAASISIERDRRPEVRLEDQQQREDTGERTDRPPELPEGRAARLALREYAAAQIASASFANSDGWNDGRAERDPAARAVDGGPITSTADEQTERDEDEGRRERAQPPVVPPLRDHHQPIPSAA